MENQDPPTQPLDEMENEDSPPESMEIKASPLEATSLLMEMVLLPTATTIPSVGHRGHAGTGLVILNKPVLGNLPLISETGTSGTPGTPGTQNESSSDSQDKNSWTHSQTLGIASMSSRQSEEKKTNDTTSRDAFEARHAAESGASLSLGPRLSTTKLDGFISKSPKSGTDSSGTLPKKKLGLTGRGQTSLKRTLTNAGLPERRPHLNCGKEATPWKECHSATGNKRSKKALKKNPTEEPSSGGTTQEETQVNQHG